MKIHLYTMSRNEADMMGFFFRHFDPWIDKYVIYDDGSTDATPGIFAAHPRVEVRPLPRTSPDSFVESAQILHNNFWKESRGVADWVVITAIDEHLYIPGRSIPDYLGQCSGKGVTCIPALGYQMISDDFPEPGELLCETRLWGFPYLPMNKLSLFNPNAVEETHYEPGRHAAAPTGRIKYPAKDELLLLHYKCLGYERTCSRERFLSTGLGAKDIANKWGYHYFLPDEKLLAMWNDHKSRAHDISGLTTAGHDRASMHARWWRPPLSARFPIFKFLQRKKK